MTMHAARVSVLVLLVTIGIAAQRNEPFPTPIASTEGVIRVGIRDFARLPDIGGEAARIMLMVDEPGSRRLFVNDMRGPLYTVSYDGRTVAPYIDINDDAWGVRVQSAGRERGFQSFAFHPQFNQPGTRGYGKFYTYTDSSNMTPAPDFTPAGAESNTHDTVLLEWTAKTPGAAAYDGGAPRELIRIRQPFANHNAGHLAFNPLARPGSPDFGVLYMGIADGGSGGDPLDLAQNLGSAFGKVFRIDPLGTNSRNKRYGIPADNPFVKTTPQALPEIYAYGVRNPQRFGWDPKNSNLFVADIGQNIVEEISLLRPGANLGWNDWEGSFGFISRTAIDMEKRRSNPELTYPVVEYDHSDPLHAGGRVAVTGVVVYRGSAVPQLANLVLFGDNPSGEVFYFSADKLPAGGQDAIRRVLFNSGGSAKTLMQIIKEQKPAVARVDLRFGTGPDDRVFLLNKQDGVIREIVK